MWLLVMVVGSGMIGLVLQNVIPRVMLDQVPAETIYSQIGHILDQYRGEAERLVELTCGRSPAGGEGGDEEALVGEPRRAVVRLGRVGANRSDAFRVR